MNPDKQEPQLGEVESAIERANEPKTFLDSIRKWANKKIMVAATVLGLYGTAACEDPAENAKDDTELNNNQNDMYEDCEPFGMCLTTGLYAADTNERIGFSFWYNVPEGKTFDDVTMKIIAPDGRELAVTHGTCFPGTENLTVSVPGFQSDIEHEEAPSALGVEISIPGEEPILIINRDFEIPEDDDAPSIGQ